MPLFIQRKGEHVYFYWRMSNIRHQFRLTCKFHIEHVLLLRFAWTYVYCTTIVGCMNSSSGHHQLLRMAPSKNVISNANYMYDWLFKLLFVLHLCYTYNHCNAIFNATVSHVSRTEHVAHERSPNTYGQLKLRCMFHEASAQFIVVIKFAYFLDFSGFIIKIKL